MFEYRPNTKQFKSYNNNIININNNKHTHTYGTYIYIYICITEVLKSTTHIYTQYLCSFLWKVSTSGFVILINHFCWSAYILWTCETVTILRNTYYIAYKRPKKISLKLWLFRAIEHSKHFKEKERREWRTQIETDSKEHLIS